MLFISACVAFGSEVQFLKALTDKKTLQNLRWDNKEEIERLSKNIWTPFEETSDDKIIFLKRGSITIGGINFEVIFNKTKSDVKRPYYLGLMAKDYGMGDFEKMREWLNVNYGSNLIQIDHSFSDSLRSSSDKTIQWKFDDTIITFYYLSEYFPSTKEFLPFPMVIHYGHSSFYKLLKEDIHISCSQRLSYTGILSSKPPEDNEDLYLIIDENNKTLLKKNKMPLKGKISVTDDNITQYNEEKKDNVISIHRIFIDRNTGVIKRTLKIRFMNSDGRLQSESGMEAYGKCKKIEAQKQF